MYEKHILNL